MRRDVDPPHRATHTSHCACNLFGPRRSATAAVLLGSATPRDVRLALSASGARIPRGLELSSGSAARGCGCDLQRVATPRPPSFTALHRVLPQPRPFILPRSFPHARALTGVQGRRASGGPAGGVAAVCDKRDAVRARSEDQEGLRGVHAGQHHQRRGVRRRPELCPECPWSAAS